MDEDKKTSKKIDIFNYVIYFFIIVILSVILTRTGLIDLKGKDTQIRIGDFNGTVKLKWLLFLAVFELNGFIHELIHYLTGKMVIPDAKFKMIIGWNLARTKRVGGDPTRIQDQIFTIMPFILLSIVPFFVGLAVTKKTDLPMYFFLINTAGSIKDIELFLCMFCFPKDMPISKMDMHTIDCNNWYRKFWLKWDDFFSN